MEEKAGKGEISEMRLYGNDGGVIEKDGRLLCVASGLGTASKSSSSSGVSSEAKSAAIC
jgi:hypothetical protein